MPILTEDRIAQNKAGIVQNDLLPIEIEFILNMFEVIEEENPPIDDNEERLFYQVQHKLLNMLTN